MLFVLEDSVFSGDDPTMPLMALLHQASKSSHHVVAVKDEQGGNYLGWLKTLPHPQRQRILDLFSFFFRRAASGRTAKKIVVSSNGATTHANGANLVTATLDFANELMTLPFCIYVENSRNDKRFLLAACTEEQRARFIELEQLNKLDFKHGGGIAELNEQLEQTHREGRLLADYSWALFDSDALVPGQPSGQSIRLAQTCTRLGVKFTQLKFRAIENYIPKSNLNGWVYNGNKHSEKYKQRTANFTAYVSLPRNLAQHYNMKKGLSADRKRPDYPSHDAIYAGVDASTLNGLTSGFGSDVSDALCWGLAEADLKALGAWQELQTMITDLESLL